MDRWQPHGWQPFGNLAEQFYPMSIQRKQGRRDDATNHDKQSHRFILKKYFSEDEQRKGRPADEQRRGVGFVQMHQEVPAVLPKTSMRSMKAEEFRQLRAGQEKRHSALESGHDTLRDEIYNRPRFGEPGHKSD